MTNLKIKAISLEDRSWVRGFGYLDYNHGHMYISSLENSLLGNDIRVIPETICRATGATINKDDKTDFIYEHDIVLMGDGITVMTGEITCDNFCFYIKTVNNNGEKTLTYPIHQLIDEGWFFVDVLGNTLDKEYRNTLKSKPIIFCISGKARHGKDTFAKVLAEYLSYFKKDILITHYGDLLKYICKSYHKWDGQKDEQGRHILQHTGTEVIRAKDPDYWTRFMRDQLDFSYGVWDAIIIPDCRFDNEMGYNFDNDKFTVYNIRVERPGFDSELTEEQKNHSSETELDNFQFFDYIYKATTLSELTTNVSILVQDIAAEKLVK